MYQRPGGPLFTGTTEWDFLFPIPQKGFEPRGGQLESPFPCPPTGPCSLGAVTSPAPSERVTVRPISVGEHLDFIRSQASASFLQTPAWGQVKSEWKREPIGWWRGPELVGVALVLYRRASPQALPRLPAGGPGHRLGHRRPGGLAQPARRPPPESGSLRSPDGPPCGHCPLVGRSGQGGHRQHRGAPPTELAPTERSQAGALVVSQLNELGWRLQATDGGFAAGQPQFNFQIPLQASPRTTSCGG